MAVGYITGFESGSLFGEPSLLAGASANLPAVVGNASLEATIVRTGSGSLKLNPASGAQGYWDAQSGSTLGTFMNIRFYLRVTTLPATARTLYGGTANQRLMLDPSGTLTLKEASGTTIVTSSTALTDTSKWYRVEIEWGTSSTWTLYVDGVSNSGGGALAAVSVGELRFGADDTVAATYTAYVDDVVMVNAGTVIGAGQAVILRPISDNSRGTWTGGAAGTTNLFDAINNAPPVGVAVGSATNTSQIKSLATVFPANGDFNMTSYTTAGIGAADTINGIQCWCNHGEDPATGTKAGGVQVVSNPAIAEQTFNFGNDVGAAGTFPTNWRSNRTAVSTTAVTLGTSPVTRVRVTSGTTAARAAFVDLLAMYVDYTPAVTRVPRSPGIDSGNMHLAKLWQPALQWWQVFRGRGWRHRLALPLYPHP